MEALHRLIPQDMVDPAVGKLSRAEVYERLDALDIPADSITAWEMEKWRDGFFVNSKGVRMPIPTGGAIEKVLKIRLSALSDTSHPWHRGSLEHTPSSIITERESSKRGIREAYIPVEFRTLGSTEKRPDVAGFAEMRDGIRTIKSNIISSVEHGVGVVITGDPGTGKTRSVCELAVEAIQNGFGAFYITAPELIELNRPGDVNEAVFATVRTVDVLVLDELGAEHVTDWTLSVIDSLLHFRHSKKLPTYITSNASWETLGTALGGRIKDRIEERSRVYELRGPSYRTRGRR